MKLNSPDDLGLKIASGQIRTSRIRMEMPGFEAGEVSAKNIKIVQEQQDNEEMAKAKVEFELAQIVESQKYDQDNDLETIEERHGAGQKEGLAKAAANITNSNIRDMFIESGNVTVAKNNAVMGQKVFRRKADQERGFMGNAFAEIVKNTINMQSGDQGLDTGEQMQQGIIAIQLSTDSMVERGVMSQEEAQGIVRKAQYDMAIGRLKAMDPADQLRALEQAWTKQLPAHLLRSLKDAALEKARDQQAHDRVMAMADMTMTQGLNELKLLAAKEGWDVEEYDKARFRFMREKKDQELGNQAMQEDLYEVHFSDIFMGYGRIEDIPNFEQFAMSAAQKSNLQLAQDNADKRAAGELVRESSDPVVEARLKQYLSEGRDIAARKYWSENYARLNTSDFRYWDRRLSPKKNSDPAFKPIRTTRQVMDEFLDQNPLNDAQKMQMWNRLEELAEEYFSRTNENMPKDLQQQWVREEFIKVTTEVEPWYWPDTEKLVQDMTTAERKDYSALTSWLRGAIPFTNQSEAAAIYSQYTLNERDELRAAIRSNPEMESWEIWARFKVALGLRESGRDAPPATDDAAAIP